MRDQHRLGPLHVGIGRHGCRACLVCAIDKCCNQFRNRLADLIAFRAYVQPQVGGNLLIAAAPAVQFVSRFADQNDQLLLYKEMTGSIRLSLYKGNVSVVSRESEHSLYRTDLSSFTMGDSYDQKDAAGFIRILGLPARSRAAALAKSKVEVAQ
jgi:hypothetical protein